MTYARNLETFDAQIVLDKRMLSACQRNELKIENNKEETDKEIEKLKGSIASLEQIVPWLRYRSKPD